MNIITNKNILSSFIKECIGNNDTEKLKTVIQRLNSNKMLSEAYFAIDNLQYGIVKENLREYVISHINILKRNMKGLDIIKGAAPFNATDIDNDIAFLLKNKKTAKNYNVWEAKVFKIASHLEQNTALASKDFNKNALLESLKLLPENHKQIIRDLTITEDKKGFYDNFKNNCILKINALLKEEKDNKHKLLLYEVKDHLTGLYFDSKNYVKDIVKINRINEMISE